MARRSRSRVRLVDKGYNRIIKDMHRLDNAYVTAGVHENAGNYEDGTPVAKVAAINEYGYGVPERPFISSTYEENVNEWYDFHKDIVEDMVLGRRTLKMGMSRLGIMMMTKTRAKITKMKTPANAPSTIARKGFNNPLIDTRTLRNSINYEVHGAGSGR